MVYIVNMMIIETILKQVKKSGLSRYRISQDTRVDQATLSRLMQGKTITVETADILLKYFGIELVAKKRQKKKRDLSETDLSEMLHQIRYEHQMLLVLGDYIVREEIKDGLLRAALLESFLVHARNLIYFFYTDKAKFSDDILAVDYFSSSDEWAEKRGILPKYLDEARTKANKLLSHITLSRIKKYKRDRGWPVLKIRNKIDEVFECFEKEKILMR